MKKWVKISIGVFLVLIVVSTVHIIKQKGKEPGETREEARLQRESEHTESEEDPATKYYETHPSDPTGRYYYVLQKYRPPECGDETEIFTSPIVQPDAINEIYPMGWAGGKGGHTLPTSTIIFKFPDEITEDVDFFAPGDLNIFEITSGFHKGMDDVWVYSVMFYACKDVKLEIGHVTDLEPKFKELVQDREGCTPYHDTDDGCIFSVNISVKAGEKIGKVHASFGPEFGMVDFRTEPLKFANPNRWYGEQFHPVCMFDYYTPEIRSQYLEKVGKKDEKRTLEPLCGTVEQDIPGTAQGVWILATEEPTSFFNHITLSYHYINHSFGQVVVGTDSLGVEWDGYRFLFRDNGFINRNFKDITPGETYCLETRSSENFADYHYSSDEPKPDYIFLIELSDPNTLKLERVDLKDCSSGPWEFKNPVEFVR